jgi:hypothetical protein
MWLFRTAESLKSASCPFRQVKNLVSSKVSGSKPCTCDTNSEMKETVNNADYRDRSLILAVIGVLLLSVGIVAAFLGPAEMYCFYLFSEGGRFHYEGFGFGSFMFGNIACQIVGYYLIAALFIPLGYGHLKVRRWARTLSLTLLWFWLVVGVPLIVVFFFILAGSKELSLAAALIVVICLGLSYTIVPGLLIWFYRSRNVKLTFETKDPKPYWMEGLPLPVLVLCSLFLLYAIALHIPILFNGIFPLLGVWLSGMQGILLIDVLIICLLCLMWGTLRLKIWAWWGSLVYFGLMTFSILTLSKSSFSDILSKMRFPPTEIEILQGLPFQGYHFAALIGIPFLITLGLIIYSKRYFRADYPVPLLREDEWTS